MNDPIAMAFWRSRAYFGGSADELSEAVKTVTALVYSWMPCGSRGWGYDFSEETQARISHLYGIVCGWSDEFVESLQIRHGWSAEFVANLRSLRAGWLDDCLWFRAGCGPISTVSRLVQTWVEKDYDENMRDSHLACLYGIVCGVGDLESLANSHGWDTECVSKLRWLREEWNKLQGMEIHGE